MRLQMHQPMKWWVLDRLDRLFHASVLGRLRWKPVAARCVRSVPVDTVYVDISVIKQQDAGTGIQRVVRSIFEHLPSLLPSSVALVPVIVRRRREGYVTLDGAPLKGRPEAIFFGLDFATESIFRHRRSLAEFRRDGGRFWFVVHDTLPVSHPKWFTAASCLRYRRWLRISAGLAEGYLCVSHSVAEAMRSLLSESLGCGHPPSLRIIRLGSDLLAGAPSKPAACAMAALELGVGALGNAVLMVGTLEPRKGHAQILDAFEEIWRSGDEIPLLLIGRRGWGTDRLQQRILRHYQLGRLLFWLEDVDDDGLRTAYEHCKMTLVASFGEGYGLPMDEALAIGSPVLARDIPVFRRHSRPGLGYFPDDAAAVQIAACIRSFYAVARKCNAPEALPTWDDTAKDVATHLGLLAGGTGQQP